MGNLSWFNFVFAFIIFSIIFSIFISSGSFISAVSSQNLSMDCSSNSQCDDGDARTYDECINPGNQNSYCRYTEINCLSDLECGFTGFSGVEFCSQNNVYKNYQLASCINPGTIQSYCLINISSNLIQNCNDNNPDTIDSCVEHTQSSPTYCSHQIFSCTQNSQCGSVVSHLTCEGNEVHNITTSPLCTQGNCGEQIQNTFVQSCSYGCSQGACLPQPPQCTQNSQCGNVSVSNTCTGNYKNITTTTPLCLSGSCEQNKTSQLILCESGCSNNTCNPVSLDECSINSDCNDSNSYTEDICSFSNSSNKKICLNNQITCLTNSDCSNSNSGNFCLNDNVYKTVTNYSCINPATQNSSCQADSSNNILVKECSNKCSNGECKSSTTHGGSGGRNLFDDLPYIITPNGEILGQELSAPNVINIEEEQEEIVKKTLPPKSDFGLLLTLMFAAFILFLILLIIILASLRKR